MLKIQLGCRQKHGERYTIKTVNLKKAEMAMLILDKIDFKAKNVTKEDAKKNERSLSLSDKRFNASGRYNNNKHIYA